MALIQRDFRKENPKPVKLRTVCGMKNIKSSLL